MKTTMRVTKKHIGRPIDFYGYNQHENTVCHGHIADVKRGLVVIGDPCFPGIYPPDGGSWAPVLLPVNSEKIVAVW